MSIRIIELGKDRTDGSATALALGNFDGVHLGHQLLLSNVRDLASQKGLVPAICTFSPHPVKFYKKEMALICTEEEKYSLLGQYGMKICFLIRFTADFAALTPEEFVEHCIIRQMNAKAVVVGHDYNFGKNRSGNADILKTLCKKNGVYCEIIEQLKVDEAPVSSSRIRKEIFAGNYEYLPKLLGRYMEYCGPVGHGAQIGATIGFPTANIALDNEVLPPDGVYAGYTHLDSVTYPVMAYMGTRPTVDSTGKRKFEANIIGYNSKESLYGRTLCITVTKKIRADRKFSSLDELKAQLAIDRETSLELFNTQNR